VVEAIDFYREIDVERSEAQPLVDEHRATDDVQARGVTEGTP